MNKVLPLERRKQSQQVRDAQICIEHVHVHLGKRCILHDVNLKIAAGQMIAVMGVNGAGKTSFLKAMLGLLPITSGTILVNLRSSQKIGYLPQISDFDREFPIRVRELVSMGLIGQKLTQNAKKQIVTSALADVDLEPYAHFFIEDLSAGLLKRALFARLLAQNADILCLDEPFAGVDENTTHELMQNLLQQQKNGKTVLAVVHDTILAQKYFTDILLLHEQSAKLYPAADITRNPMPSLRPPYGA